MARTKGGRETQVEGDSQTHRGLPSRCGSRRRSRQWKRQQRPPYPRRWEHRAVPGLPSSREGCRLSPAGGTVAAAFVQRPQAGEGAEASKAEQRAPESAPVPPPPVWPPPSFPELRALCSRPGAGATGSSRPGVRCGKGGARYLRVFVEQRQALFGHFEALGQPLAQPLHRLVGGHRQLVASARCAVDGQAHGRCIRRGAQLAGAARGPAPAAPGAARLRLHPRPALGNWGPRGNANPRRASGQGRGSPNQGSRGHWV